MRVSKIMLRIVAVLMLGCFSFGALLACTPSMRINAYSALLRDNHRFPPFEIAPGLYYVGSSDIAVFALTTRDGIVLIDSGYEDTARQVVANLRELRLDPADVRVLLNTHAHFDHAAGLSWIKQETGAQLYASPRDAPLLENGGEDDFFLDDWMRYPSVRVDHLLADGVPVTLGGLALTPHFTPGHTKGCTSWSFPIVVDGAERQALIICSLNTLAFDLTDNPDYPGIAADFSDSFRILRGLRCEVFLGAHAKFFDMRIKRTLQRAGARLNPFVDPEGCAAFINESEADFRRDLARQTR